MLNNTFGLKDSVRHIFYSHLLGLAKPETKAFEYVLNTLNVAASEVMFFDDNQANVLAAKQLGIHAYQAFSPQDVEHLIKINS